MEEEYISVTELTNHISKVLKRDSNLRKVFVRGEISNFKQYISSGHCYFKLKDENTIIPAVMYYSVASRLKFKPKNGMKVLIRGKVEVYSRNGAYQLYVNKLSEDGLGDLHIAFEQLKIELKELGWFDEAHKKEIPKFPKKVGVVTSPEGAAIRDIITTIKRRWPLCEIILFPSLVQGNMAMNNIVKQIYTADSQFDLDTLIVARGGGSIEDLWSFNERSVAKTIFYCDTPIISAVGHDIDFTIADFVADLRAPTPTAAGELAVPEINEVKDSLNNLNQRANKSINKKQEDNGEKLEKIKDRNLFIYPEMIYEKKAMDLDNLKSRLLSSSNEMIYASKFELDSLKRRLIDCSNKIIYDNNIKLSGLKGSVIFKNPNKIFENKSNKYFELIYKLKYGGDNLIYKKELKLLEYKNSFIFKNPKKLFEDKSGKYLKIKARLEYSSKNLLRDKKEDLKELKDSRIIKNPESILDKKIIYLGKYIDKLTVLDPLLTIKRGYTVSRVNGKVISKSKDLKVDDEVEIEFSDGKVNTKVI
ncbi:exodeoxyribonuclease VII large subunit [Methanobrevibacter olleyae]|uniref:Exodeoxyribonuclease VII large subunit XseA n=1 Tax=Methanobrevibacter olleyae TaxID=294671 RepID=A0A126QXU8_METOL|nr:exodeoxyribonuclease VII large subunit [Methanobrevibacter olleyae]AMK14960.1 exodeoxyribonuclease VII large subunit XseA [Methanobrevibacter olleyae]